MPYSAQALFLAIFLTLAGAARTVFVTDEAGLPIEATVTIQTLPDRASVFDGKTNNGAITIPEKSLAETKSQFLLVLVQAVDSKKYKNKPMTIPKVELQKGSKSIKLKLLGL